MITKDREELISKFQNWLDTNPRKTIISAECANIAQDYADKIFKKIEDFNKNSESIAYKSFEFMVADEGLFPNHTDKDIWINGFKSGIEWLFLEITKK